MGYLRQRLPVITLGFTLGLVIGWLQPFINGVEPPEGNARFFLVLQMGAAFAIIALFISNYLDLRRRVQAKYGKQSTP